jgi:membrane protease YdiL (CAAX protease family)
MTPSVLTSQVDAPAGRPWATVAGLFFSLVAPFLEYLVFQGLYGPTQSLTRTALGIAVHLANFMVVVLIVVRAEGNPLASIGVRPLQWSTIPLGLAAGVLFTIVAGVLASLLKLNSDAVYVGYLQSLPFVVRVLLVVTAGVFEETLYRGYALERFASMWGSKWLAAIATLALFTVMHVPAVGWAHLLPVAIMGSLVTLLYLWKRNLLVNVVAHTTIDAIGLLVAPLFSH